MNFGEINTGQHRCWSDVCSTGSHVWKSLTVCLSVETIRKKDQTAISISAKQGPFFTGTVWVLFISSGKSCPSAVLAYKPGFSLSESLLTDKLSLSPLPCHFFHFSLTHSLSRPGCAEKEKTETLWVVGLSCSLGDWEEADRQTDRINYT